MIVHVDTREQITHQWRFSTAQPGEALFSRNVIAHGDYAVSCRECAADGIKLDCRFIEENWPESLCIIERKSLDDLYNTLADKERRQRQADKFADARRAGVGWLGWAVEADWRHIRNANDYLTRPSGLHPASVVGTLRSWPLRYGIHIITADVIGAPHEYEHCRSIVEAWAFRLFQRWLAIHR